MKIENELGNIEISRKAIADIVGNAAMSCYGLVGMAHQRGKDGLIEILNRTDASKGVSINLTDDDRLVIELYVIIEQAVKISVVAENIISTVKYCVEKETSLKVKTISVNVVSVRV